MQVRIFKQDENAEGGFAEAGKMALAAYFDAHPELHSIERDVIAHSIAAGVEYIGTAPSGDFYKLQREG